MPRQIDARTTMDDLEDEILYTRAALQADPDASDLLPMTDGWMAMVDAARSKMRGASEATINADARRCVANARLDHACVAFANELEYAVNKDRQSARYRQFFANPVSRFVRQSLASQIATVRGWLDKSQDEVFKKYSKELRTWSEAAMGAVEQTAGTALVRGQAWVLREQLAEDLTRERDGLYAALLAHGTEHKLQRNWADVFFRVQSRHRKAHDAPELPPPATSDAVLTSETDPLDR